MNTFSIIESDSGGIDVGGMIFSSSSRDFLKFKHLKKLPNNPKNYQPTPNQSTIYLDGIISLFNIFATESRVDQIPSNSNTTGLGMTKL